MSRIGRMPVTIPAGVEVSIAEPNVVTVKGPKGTLTQTMRPEMIIKVEGNVIHVGRPSEDKLHKSLHGLTRSLIHDMVVGVTDGFKKELEINGVGYKASKEELLQDEQKMLDEIGIQLYMRGLKQGEQA